MQQAIPFLSLIKDLLTTLQQIYRIEYLNNVICMDITIIIVIIVTFIMSFIGYLLSLTMAFSKIIIPI